MAPVKLTVVANELEAEVVCGLLRSNGIPSTFRTLGLGTSIGGESGATGSTEILVEEANLEAARELLPED